MQKEGPVPRTEPIGRFCFVVIYLKLEKVWRGSDLSGWVGEWRLWIIKPVTYAIGRRGGWIGFEGVVFSGLLKRSHT